MVRIAVLMHRMRRVRYWRRVVSDSRVLLRVMWRSGLLISWLKLGDMGSNDFGFPFLLKGQVSTDAYMHYEPGNGTYMLQFRKDLFRNAVLIELGLNVRYHIVDDGTIYVWLR